MTWTYFFRNLGAAFGLVFVGLSFNFNVSAFQYFRQQNWGIAESQRQFFEGVLKNSQNAHENTCARVSFLIKLLTEF